LPAAQEPAPQPNADRQPASDPASSEDSAAQLKQNIGAYVRTRLPVLMNEYRVPGAVLAFVRRGQVYVLDGYGYGDLEHQARVDPLRTRFPVGQISTTITTAAVLRAHDQGLLDLSVPADTYLADILPRHSGRSLTIDDLLRRQTGFAALRETAGFTAPAEVPSLADYLRRKLPDFHRRDDEASEYEISLLGHILERQSRLSFADHLDRLFLRSLGMTASSFQFPRQDTLANVTDESAATDGESAQPQTIATWARGYRYLASKHDTGEAARVAGAVSYATFEILPDLYYAPAPALGLSTTGQDMTHFIKMLLQKGVSGNARLLSEASAKRMLDVSVDDRFLRPTYYYGLTPYPYDPAPRATADGPRGDGRPYSSGGVAPPAYRILVNYATLPGYAAVLCLIPGQDTGIFFITNSFAPELRDRVLRELLDRFVFSDGSI
jgi:CubicO group peptidase (beta-lactamase class C family)